MSFVNVFAASKSEAEPVQRIVHAAASATSSGNVLLRLGWNEFLLIIGGMGPKAARAKAMEALGSSPTLDGSNLPADQKTDAVLAIGLCGSLSNSLPETRIVAYTDCLSTEPTQPPLRCPASVTNRLLDLLSSRGITCDRVTGITSPRVAVTKEEKLLLARSGANVVDMESYEIMDVATEAGIPGAVLRVVSDSLETEMVDFNRALKPDGTVDQWQLFRLVLGSPLRMIRLLAASKRAMKEFAKALEVVLPSDCFAPAAPPVEK
jgi:hypothetical protein